MNDLNYSRNLAMCRRAGRSHFLFLLHLLIAGLGFTTAGRGTAQTYINRDGANPYAGLILLRNTLYGTASAGGIQGNGTVFAIHTDGTGFTNLHSLTYSDGVGPSGGFGLSGNTLYGTAHGGGSSGIGTVFAIHIDGTSFTNLHSFSFSDGANPDVGLVLSGNSNTLYGATTIGGSSGNGTVFALNTEGTEFTNLHSFTVLPGSAPYTNSDGGYPSSLVVSGNTLFGTTQNGGSLGAGTVFKVNTNGSGFTTLYSFPPSSTNSSGTYTNSNGANPVGLIVSGNTLYGTAASGGSSGFGTVFKVNTDGTEFTNLHSFNYSSDGASPRAGLVLSGNTLYGTASGGGSSSIGTVFKLNTDGMGFTVLHSFNWSDGANPNDLVLSGNTLFGTTYGYGGTWDFGGRNGTVFALNTDGTGFTNLYSFTALFIPPPHLTVIISGTNVVLTWPTNSYGVPGTYLLASTTNLVSPAGWTAAAGTGVVVNGKNTVTNSITGTQQFYSLAFGCWLNADCNHSNQPGIYTCVGGGLVGECVRRGSLPVAEP